MTTIRSLLFNLLFALWTALIFIFSLPTLVLPRSAAGGWAACGCAVRCCCCARSSASATKCAAAEHRVTGPAIYAAEHQSAWDTLVFPLLLDKPAYVLKRELIRVPLFGSYLKQCGMIPVDREGGGSALKQLLRAARTAVARGRSILIYPEGTRMPPGERRPYHPGVAALYGDLGVPVGAGSPQLGIVLGPPRFHKKPGTITIEFLPPIAPGLPRREFMRELQERMEGASQRLAAADTG